MARTDWTGLTGINVVDRRAASSFHMGDPRAQQLLDEIEHHASRQRSSRIKCLGLELFARHVAWSSPLVVVDQRPFYHQAQDQETLPNSAHSHGFLDRDQPWINQSRICCTWAQHCFALKGINCSLRTTMRAPCYCGRANAAPAPTAGMLTTMHLLGVGGRRASHLCLALTTARP